MRIPKCVAATALTLAVLNLCACTGVVGLAHGDPGRAPEGELQGQVPAALPDTSATPLAATAPAAAPASTGTATPTGALPDTVVAPPVAFGAVNAVTVTFNDHAQQLAAADPRLTPAALAAAVETELQTHQLYAPAAAGLHRTLTITVEDLSTTLASNATVLGYTFRNVMLTGGVKVEDKSAAERSPFEVRALARMADRAPDAAVGSLARLYTRFAVLTVADLRGVEAPPQFLPR